MQIARDLTESRAFAGYANKKPIEKIEQTDRLGKDDFLKLLVTQLQTQDPLEPMSNEDFIAQTAQFSSLEQMENLNKAVSGQTELQRTMTNMSAIQFVGKNVQAYGSKFQLKNGMPVQLKADLPQQSDVVFEVYDQNNKKVSFANLGLQRAGQINTVWTGKDLQGNQQPDGSYTIRVSAINAQGVAIDAKPIISGPVNGISYQDGNAKLSVNGDFISPQEIISATIN